MLLHAQLLAMHHIQQESCSSNPMSNGRMVHVPVHKGGALVEQDQELHMMGSLCFVQVHPHRRMDEPNSNLGQGGPFHFSYM